MMSNFSRLEDKSSHLKWASEADGVEWQALNYGSSSFTSSELDELISGEFEEDQRESELDQFMTTSESVVITDEQLVPVFRKRQAQRHRKTSKQETLAAGIRSEIERRAFLLKEHYPFKVESNGIRENVDYDRAAHQAYRFFLKTAVNPSAEDREHFERVVADALKRYLGERSEVLGFGWQSLTESNTKINRIREMVMHLKTYSGEWQWAPEDGLPDDPTPTLIKDMGIDVIAWLPVPDGREGQIFLVAQCATGHTDWENKLTDVDWDRIETWVRPSPKRWSVRCFAVPFHLPNLAHWRSTSKAGGLLLDRVRLTLLLQ